jgi:hypothetical protein
MSRSHKRLSTKSSTKKNRKSSSGGSSKSFAKKSRKSKSHQRTPKKKTKCRRKNKKRSKTQYMSGGTDHISVDQRNYYIITIHGNKRLLHTPSLDISVPKKKDWVYTLEDYISNSLEPVIKSTFGVREENKDIWFSIGKEEIPVEKRKYLPKNAILNIIKDIDIYLNVDKDKNRQFVSDDDLTDLLGDQNVSLRGAK